MVKPSEEVLTFHDIRGITFKEQGLLRDQSYYF